MDRETTTYRVKPEPVRTCVGCRTREPQARLLRVALAGGLVTADPKRRLPGRGAYIHPRPDCARQALHRGGFARAFRGQVKAAPAFSAVVSDAEALRSVVAAEGTMAAGATLTGGGATATHAAAHRNLGENVVKGQK